MFAFRLARDLGMAMGELRQMPAAEFTRWMAYYTYEHKMQAEAARKARR